MHTHYVIKYSDLSNIQEEGNKRGGSAKVLKSMNVEKGINENSEQGAKGVKSVMNRGNFARD